MEIGKQYIVKNKMKKSSTERETMANGDGVVVARNILWRSIEFVITPQNEEEVESLQEALESDEDFMPYDYEDCEFVGSWDGQSEWYDLVDGEFDLEGKETEFENLSEEESDEYFGFSGYLTDACGFDWDEVEVTIEGGISIEETA